jgi:hypothetical protein
VTVNGTADAPITIRGVPDNLNRRPILERTTVFKNVVNLHGDFIVFENFIVDGGMREFIAWLNGAAEAGNRFNHISLSKPVFPGEVVTFENLHTFLRREVTIPIAGNDAFTGFLDYFTVSRAPLAIDAALEPSKPNNTHLLRELFAKRGIFQGGGNHVTVRNCLSMGSGTGLTSADIGPGSLTVEYCEFAYNGMNMAGHNVYLNGDNGVYCDLHVEFKHNYVHHALAGTMGFRSRIGRTVLRNNFFLDNGARHVDVICTMKYFHDFEAQWHKYIEIHGEKPARDWWWATRFAFREDHELIGNVFVNTEMYNFGGLRIGGASPQDEHDWMEAGCGRYRFVNNTLVHLAKSTELRGAIEAHFGVESVEMYNNIFYSNSPNIAPFWDMLNNARINAYIHPETTDDPGEPNFNTWRFGVRQVAGAHNWVSHGMADTRMPGKDGYYIYNGVPDEWVNTVHGTPGENPFADLGAYDFRVRTDSTAYCTGSPVGAAADFLSREGYEALKTAGKLPEWTDYRYGAEGAFTKGYTTVAPWQDNAFPNPSTQNPGSPPLVPVPGGLGIHWDCAGRADSEKPRVGAY